MDDSPAEVFKTKPNSSLNVALKFREKTEADALVSAGNTGAVLCILRLDSEGFRESAERLSERNDSSRMEATLVFDVGATVDCRPNHLFEYAIMGSIYSRLYLLKIENPKIGLLSVGEEKIKGNEISLSAYEMLEKAPINFMGNVEGR